MTNGYIKIADIRKILNDIEKIEGYINKNEFQLSITKLKEHRKPKVKTSPLILKGVTARDMINNINRYQNEIKFNPKDGYLYKLFAYEIEYHNLSLKDKEVCFKKDSSLNSRLENRNIIVSNIDLREVLGISQRKLSKLKRYNLIPWEMGIEIALYGKHGIIAEKYLSPYYNLEEIKTNLKRLKQLYSLNTKHLNKNK